MLHCSTTCIANTIPAMLDTQWLSGQSRTHRPGNRCTGWVFSYFGVREWSSSTTTSRMTLTTTINGKIDCGSVSQQIMKFRFQSPSSTLRFVGQLSQTGPLHAELVNECNDGDFSPMIYRSRMNGVAHYNCVDLEVAIHLADEGLS